MYKIGEFSKMAQVSPKMLKYYERCGLIRPVQIAEKTGYRYYDTDQLILVSRIRILMDMGFSTSEVGDILNSHDTASYFSYKIDELKKKIDDDRRRIMLLDFYGRSLEKQRNGTFYHARIKTIEGCMTAAKRLVIKSIFDLPAEWQKHYEEVRLSGSEILRFPNSLTCFHDREYTVENNDIELILMLRKTGTCGSSFFYRKMPSFSAVSVIHNGSYDFMSDAYAFAFHWMESAGFSICGDPMESYLKSIYNTDDENEFITEILIPVSAFS